MGRGLGVGGQKGMIGLLRTTGQHNEMFRDHLGGNAGEKEKRPEKTSGGFGKLPTLFI